MYRFQVCLDKGTKTERWEDVHPVGGAPYEYTTRGAAEDMARMCYGKDPSLTRVVEVDTVPMGVAPTPEGGEDF